MHDDRRFPYEKVARLDSPERLERQPPAALVALVSSFAPSRILDVGVGTGTFLIPCAVALPDAEAVGLDVEPRMLEIFANRARERGLDGRARSLQAALRGRGSVPLEDGSVDVALMVNFYHEIDDRPAALAEVARLLARSGRLVIADWDPEGPEEHGPPRDHRVAPGTARREVAEAGLSAVEEPALWPGFFALVASKPAET